MPITGFKKNDLATLNSLPLSTQLHEYLEVSLSSRGILLKPFDNSTSISSLNDNILFPWEGGIIRCNGEDKGELGIIVGGCGGILNGFQSK